VYTAPRSWVESMIISRHPARGFLRSWTSAMPQVSPSAGFARRSSTATTCHRLSTCVLARCPPRMGSFEDRHPDGIRSPRSLTCSRLPAPQQLRALLPTGVRCHAVRNTAIERKLRPHPWMSTSQRAMPLRAEQTSLHPHPIRDPGRQPFKSHTPSGWAAGSRASHQGPQTRRLTQARESRPVLTRGRIRAGCLGSVGAGDGGVLGHRSGF